MFKKVEENTSLLKKDKKDISKDLNLNSRKRKI